MRSGSLDTFGPQLAQREGDQRQGAELVAGIRQQGVHQLVRQRHAGALGRAADHVDQGESRRCSDREAAGAQKARQRVVAQRLREEVGPHGGEDADPGMAVARPRSSMNGSWRASANSSSNWSMTSTSSALSGAPASSLPTTAAAVRGRSPAPGSAPGGPAAWPEAARRAGRWRARGTGRPSVGRG